MKAFGENARGVMVADTSTSDDELDRLNRLGVRGVRFHMNLQYQGPRIERMSLLRHGHWPMSQLGTKYLNEIFIVTREVRDGANGVVKIPADYSQLGDLLIIQVMLALALPFAAILFVRLTRLRSA